MQVNKDRIGFGSKIKLIDPLTYKSKIKSLNPKKHNVGYPWNENVIKKGKVIYTEKIMDCIAGGVIDNNSIVMFHECTRNQAQAKRTRQKGFDIKNFERRILEKINLASENLHAFLIGGFQLEDNSKYNINKTNKIKKVFEKYNIPYTKMIARKDVHFFSNFSILYDGKDDTMYVTSNLINSIGLNGQGQEVELQGRDVLFHTYRKNFDKGYLSYERTLTKGSTFDYFASQFREVQLSHFDEFA